MVGKKGPSHPDISLSNMADKCPRRLGGVQVAMVTGEA